MWDGRREAGRWNSWASPLQLVLSHGLWLVLGVVVVAQDFDGMVRALLLAFVLAVFTIGVLRDIRRSRQVAAEK